MYIAFLILSGINAFIYFYAFLKDIQIIQESKLFKKAIEAGTKIGENIEKTYNEQDSKAEKAGYIFGTIISIITIVLMYGVVIYVPILVGLKYGVSSAIATYLSILLVSTSSRLLKYGSRSDFDAKKMILMSLVAIFKFQVMILILFSFKFTLASIIEDIYTSEFFLSNTLSFVMPILFFSSIIVTIYLYWIGLKVNSKLNVNKYYKPKLSHFILIMVIASVSGIIFLIESDFDFIDMSSGSSFDRIYNIFILLLASVLIPAMLNLISNRRTVINPDENLYVKNE